MTTIELPRERLQAGTPELRRLSTAMLAAGLSTFGLLYATQALLPDIGAAFGVGATAATLTVAVTTAALALTVLPMSALAERVGRTRVMTAGLAVASVTVLVAAASPWFWLLLALRAVDGVALAGVVAVAIGHIGDEVEPAAAGRAIGLYVSGTTLGGLAGRLLPAGVSEFASWRWSMAAVAIAGAVGTLVFTRLAGPHRGGIGVRSVPHATRALLRTGDIARLCAVALLLMGGFVATFNYLTFRLQDAPFHLSPSSVGLVFLAYLSGTLSSTYAAALASRFGRRRVVLTSLAVAVVGIAITTSDSLPVLFAGLLVFTAGFFGAHSVASGWTSSLARLHKSQAAALYLMAYYLGSGLGGTAIGLAWSAGGWPATVLAVGGCYLAAAGVVLSMRDR